MEQTAPQGIWITDGEFAALTPRNVFSREIGKVVPDCTDHRDRHILFRKRFFLVAKPKQALLRITADDYYKAWLNGRFAGQGPAAAYPQRYGYNVLDVTDLLREGENVLAVHTLYQGLINRVWVSGDNRHGLLCDLLCDGVPVLQSDEIPASGKPAWWATTPSSLNPTIPPRRRWALSSRTLTIPAGPLPWPGRRRTMCLHPSRRKC